MESAAKKLSFKDATAEPFRLFFPQAVLAGIIGVILWPLHFWGVMESYPNLSHVRVMTYGFFGGFIFGFLGTALPRMLSARPLSPFETMALLVLHGATVLVFAAGKIVAGDVLLLATLAVFAVCVIRRVRSRKDTPPPGFVLVGLSFACVIAGALLAIAQYSRDMDPQWIHLQRLLTSQGFVLLPILGIGPFILPRFFGMESAHDFPEAMTPNKEWIRKALFALGAGLLIVGSFFVEIAGWYRTAYGMRSLTTLVYLALEFPFARAPKSSNALGASVRIAFAMVLAGFIAVTIWPVYRLGLLHLTLVGGFAIVTFVVATRVVFGHSGNIAQLKGKNRWLLWAVGLMLFAMATRVSGDFWPHILISHYNYGALLWTIAVLLWAWKVLPKVRQAEPED